MCKLFRSHLVEGCTAAAIREGDFLYSYHLWFEDSVVGIVPLWQLYVESNYKW